MLAAVLGCMDKHGRRCLLANGYITARLPWERFHGNSWRGICDYTLLHGRPGEQQPQHEAPRKLSIRVAQWITYTCSKVEWYSDSRAYEVLRVQVESLVKKGESSV